jgi:hypothetical protein
MPFEPGDGRIQHQAFPGTRLLVKKVPPHFLQVWHDISVYPAHGGVLSVCQFMDLCKQSGYVFVWSLLIPGRNFGLLVLAHHFASPSIISTKALSS